MSERPWRFGRRPGNEGWDEAELFEAIRAFLKRAHVHHREHWVITAARAPLIELCAAARRITGERDNDKALAALAPFLEAFLSPYDAMAIFRQNGGVNEDFCETLREQYREWKLLDTRAKQRKGGHDRAHQLLRGSKKPGV